MVRGDSSNETEAVLIYHSFNYKELKGWVLNNLSYHTKESNKKHSTL